MTRARATALGLTAILMWSALALLTVWSAPVPPLLLNVLCFGLGGTLGLGWAAAQHRLGVLRAVPWHVYAFGTAGLFGYHAVYFTAFRLAQQAGVQAQAGLIAYLWPLFIVLLSGLLPGERLRAAHVAGALLAFAGAALIVLRNGAGTGSGAAPALGLAFLCALTWAGYSVISRRLGSVPTESVAVFCLATAALSLPLHLWLETTAWPAGAAGWGAVLALGLGPVGAAFFTWDIGMKRGDIQFLGVASYAAPLLSTLALVAAGIAQGTALLAVAALMIAGGAAVAARAPRR
jgi:drug/metabolite transporter (DMT)-like permease